MNKIEGLSPLERLALWILHHSQRAALVIVKPMGCPSFSYSVHQSDPVAMAVIEQVFGQQDDEPPSLQLERIYHLPAYGEEE